jgi:hypothetical protein
LTDAVEKGFSVPERRRIFHERLPVENIDLGILHFGFYYCPLWMVHRSLIDFFNSIDPKRHGAWILGHRPQARPAFREAPKIAILRLKLQVDPGISG